MGLFGKKKTPEETVAEGRAQSKPAAKPAPAEKPVPQPEPKPDQKAAPAQQVAAFLCRKKAVTAGNDQMHIPGQTPRQRAEETGNALPMIPTTFTWRFKLILKKHGLPEKLDVYSLRHTNASLLLANGTDVATVAGLLGHSHATTTTDIYTHAFDKNKKAASQALHHRLEI